MTKTQVEAQSKQSPNPNKVEVQDTAQLLEERCRLWIQIPLQGNIDRSTTDMKDALQLNGSDGSLIRKWISHIKAGHKVAMLAKSDKYEPREQQYVWHFAFWCSLAPHHQYATPDGNLVAEKDAQPRDIKIPKLRFAAYISKAEKGGFPELRPVVHSNGQEPSSGSTSSAADLVRAEREARSTEASNDLTSKLVQAGQQTYDLLKKRVADPIGDRIVDGLLGAVGESVKEKLDQRLDQISQDKDGGLLVASGLNLDELADTVAAAFDPDAFVGFYESKYGGEKKSA